MSELQLYDSGCGYFRKNSRGDADFPKPEFVYIATVKYHDGDVDDVDEYETDGFASNFQGICHKSLLFDKLKK
jgi:hypothetical protein